jgi:hypothetical protein
MLVENTRTNGRVKQDIVAMLGTIDATWLESFWTDQKLKIEHWELYSLRHRVAFWDGVIARMSQIGDNRLSKDDRVAIRRAIHKVIPWPMEHERKRLEVLEAQKVYDDLAFAHSWSETRITHAKKAIARATAVLKEREPRSARIAEDMLLAGLLIEHASKK